MAKHTPSLKTPVEPLDRTATRALYEQLYRAIRDRIVGGELRPGERLPSSRALARSLGISRNTVLSAYDRLADQNLIRAKVGSGTRVEASEARAGSSNAAPSGGRRTGGRALIETLRSAAVLFRQSRYPLRSAVFLDRDGNTLYLYDCRYRFNETSLW